MCDARHPLFALVSLLCYNLMDRFAVKSTLTWR